MSVPPERLPQGLEELRGDYEEMGRHTLTPALSGTAASVTPLFLDGRLALIAAASYSGAGGRGDVGGIFRRLQALASTTITGVATNNVTLNVRRMLANVAQATIATVTFAAGTTWAAGTPIDLNVSGVQLQPGEYVDLQVALNGTGLAAGLPAILWTFEYTRFSV